MRASFSALPAPVRKAAPYAAAVAGLVVLWRLLPSAGDLKTQLRDLARKLGKEIESGAVSIAGEAGGAAYDVLKWPLRILFPGPSIAGEIWGSSVANAPGAAYLNPTPAATVEESAAYRATLDPDRPYTESPEYHMSSADYARFVDLARRYADEFGLSDADAREQALFDLGYL